MFNCIKIKKILENKKDFTKLKIKALKEARRCWIEDKERTKILENEIFELRANIEERLKIEKELERILKNVYRK